MRNFYLIFMLVCFMGGMVLSAKAEEKEPLVIEMLNKRGKEKMLYGQDVAKIDVGQTITWTPDSKGHNVQFVSVPEGVEKVKSFHIPLNKRESIYMSAHHTQLWV